MAEFCNSVFYQSPTSVVYIVKTCKSRYNDKFSTVIVTSFSSCYISDLDNRLLLSKLAKNSPWLLDTQVMYTICIVIRLPQAHRKVNSLVRHDYNIYVCSTYIYNIDIIPISCIPWPFASFDKIILHFFNFL